MLCLLRKTRQQQHDPILRDNKTTAHIQKSDKEQKKKWPTATKKNKEDYSLVQHTVLWRQSGFVFCIFLSSLFAVSAFSPCDAVTTSYTSVVTRPLPLDSGETVDPSPPCPVSRFSFPCSGGGREEGGSRETPSGVSTSTIHHRVLSPFTIIDSMMR